MTADAELRELIESFLGVRIRSLRAEPSPYATLFPAEIVSLELDDGRQLSLFAKHLGSEQSDHPEKQCRDREVRVYRDLFRDAALPVPAFVGSRWDARTERHDLFLEYVDGWNLKYHGVERWVDAARALGRLHAYFAGSELLDHPALLRFDQPALVEGARRALLSVRLAYPGLVGRLRAVVTRYEAGIDLIAAQPVTLVHNGCSPKNVLADGSRIRIVDWELAGVGCGLVDLMHLRHGLDEAGGEAMFTAYCEAVAGTDLLSPPGERVPLVAACELERLLHKFWRSRFWNTPATGVAGWLGEAEQHAERL